jgi:hypothetical protein
VRGAGLEERGDPARTFTFTGFADFTEFTWLTCFISFSSFFHIQYKSDFKHILNTNRRIMLQELTQL